MGTFWTKNETGSLYGNFKYHTFVFSTKHGTTSGQNGVFKMGKTKCYSVRLVSMVSISEKAYKLTAYDGSTCTIPKSAFFGEDYEVQKSEAFWIAAFALEGKPLQYSTKKTKWFEYDLGKGKAKSA